MLWYKSWLETRWRFLLGMALLLVSAAGVVLVHPQLMKLAPAASYLEFEGEIGRQVRESMQLVSTYRGYVWSQWVVNNMVKEWTLFAVLLGTGGLLAQASRGGALFTLSLPVSRSRILTVRAAISLLELLALALIPSLLIPLLSPVVGQTYGVGDALVHALCLFVGGAAFFSFAFLLSTVFGDIWRPALIALCVAFALSVLEQVFRDLSTDGIFRIMAAESYFRGRGVPWLGLMASAAASFAMLYGATRNIARQDF